MGLGRSEIEAILPHRPPFLLIDEVVELEPGSRVVARKHVREDEFWTTGHFPGRPVMPGVLIVEAMAQCSAVLVLRGIPDRDEKLFLFGGVDKARFRKPVIPGDQLRMECEVLQRRSNTIKVKGVASVDGAMVAEAEMLSIMVERPK